MNEIPKNNRGWRILRRVLITLAVFATLIAIFYTEEDWRGKRAWEKCKAELEAQGVVLDWGKYLPPSVPDDQNFFMASTNILLRFVKAQTPAQSDAAAQLSWLRLPPFGSNSFPVLDTAKSKPLVVVELAMGLSTSVAPAPDGSHALIVKLNAANAREQVQDLVRATVGRGILGAAGFQFSERQLSNLAPARIVLQSDTMPSIAELGSLIPEDLVTNVGHLRIETAGGGKSFQVLLTGVRITAAEDYLKWSDQFVPAFDEIREALKRPYAIIPGDYSRPFLMPIPNFVTMRGVAQTLAQRTQCYLLLGQPDKALHEVTLMHDICRILERPPTGRPITLVEAMIHVAITGLYVATVADGFRWHAWQEPQIAALQEQLKGINLSPIVAKSFKMEQVGSICLYETIPRHQVINLFGLYRIAGLMSPGASSFDKIGASWQLLKNPTYLFLRFAPRGWWYQNMVNLAVLEQMPLKGFDMTNDTVSPRAFENAQRDTEGFFQRNHISPFKLLAAISVPNFLKATQTTAHNQMLVNEAQIVCALERYRLAHGDYPETLDALVPQFIEKLPHDIIGGQPLHYRRTADQPSQSSGSASGKFLLYSVGWNETDDGGQDGGTDFTKGDWVWRN